MTLTIEQLNAALHSNPDLTLADPDAITQPQRAHAVGSERDMQAAVIAECDRRALVDPRWELVACIPNGLYRRGKRPEPGIRAGIPDLYLPVPAHGYHSFWCELKIQPNRLSDSQRRWIDILREHGHFVAAIWDSADAVVQLIDWYLGEAGS